MIHVSGIILVKGSLFFNLRKPNELNIPDVASQNIKVSDLVKDYIKHYMLILKYIISCKNNRIYEVNIGQ
jgi:hypothetical protein